MYMYILIFILLLDHERSEHPKSLREKCIRVISCNIMCVAPPTSGESVSLSTRLCALHARVYEREFSLHTRVYVYHTTCRWRDKRFCASTARGTGLCA